jgi:hypothetical protein
VRCGHKLIAGEAHLWGCQVGAKLFWLQLDSIIVLVDCFLGRKAGDHFSLLPLPWSRNGHFGGLFPWLKKSFCFLEAFLVSTKGLLPISTETQLTVRVFLLP